MIGYLPGGPEAWRVSYNYKIKQFDDIDKAMAYMKEKLTSHSEHMLVLQRVNLKEGEIKNE